MLPIDEHAKSGAWVWGLARSGSTMRKIKWDAKEPLPGAHWICTQGMIFDDDAFTHYLPEFWPENAAKMREALHGLFVGCRGADTAALRILAATEWPPERETRDD